MSVLTEWFEGRSVDEPPRTWREIAMEIFCMICLGLLLGMACAEANAQDWLSLHGLAKHLDGKVHCNSTTSGLGVEHGISQTVRAMAGFYRNSNCRYSAYAGGAYTPLALGQVHLGALAGVVSGYRNSVLPAAGLVAALEWQRFGVDVVFIPPYKDSGNVLWVSAKVPF
jgi:hypothetical protein